MYLTLQEQVFRAYQGEHYTVLLNTYRYVLVDKSVVLNALFSKHKEAG